MTLEKKSHHSSVVEENSIWETQEINIVNNTTEENKNKILWIIWLVENMSKILEVLNNKEYHYIKQKIIPKNWPDWPDLQYYEIFINFNKETWLKKDCLSDIYKYCKDEYKNITINGVEHVKELLINDKNIGYYSINISSLDLNNFFINFLFDLVVEYPWIERYIKFELLENIESWELNKEQIDTLKQIQKLWFCIWIDDFYTWSSNLNLILLTWIKWDFIKFDGIILQTLKENKLKNISLFYDLILNTIKMIKTENPDIKIIIEKIEDQWDLDRLWEINDYIDYYQWYYFSKPQ